MGITIKNNMKCVSSCGGFLKMTKQRGNKLKKSAKFCSSEKFDSGYFRNEPKKVE